MAGKEPLHEWGMGRRVPHDVGGVAVWVAPIKYVILRKLEWHREGAGTRHLDDVRGMLRVSGGSADQAALGAWVARLGLLKEWQLVAELLFP